jgi:hypothetical protein
MGRLARALSAGFTQVLSISAQSGPSCIWFAGKGDIFQVAADTHQITQKFRFGGLHKGQAEATHSRAGK